MRLRQPSRAETLFVDQGIENEELVLKRPVFPEDRKLGEL